MPTPLQDTPRRRVDGVPATEAEADATGVHRVGRGQRDLVESLEGDLGTLEPTRARTATTETEVTRDGPPP
jgi:hypothetical protein